MARASHCSGIAVILAVAVLASACDRRGGGPPTAQPVVTKAVPTPSPSTVLPMVTPTPDSSSEADRQVAVDAALRDAAGRLGLASGAGDMHVQQVEARQWPDSSLGCPRQDEMYSQIVTPGYVVVLSAAGRQLEYHADSRGTVVFCQEF